MPWFHRKKQSIRALRHDVADAYSKEEVLALLKAQLFAPAKKIDAPLVRECLLTLDPALENESPAIAAQTWARIQAGITEPRAMAFPRKKLAVIVLTALLMLALAAVALAIAFGRLTIDFPSWVRPQQTVTDEAETLVQYDLATAHFEHVDVEVREALYDGDHLRLVYAVIDKRPGAILTEADIQENILPAAMLDNLHCCDWIEVDGQEIYLWDTFQRPGSAPNEMLYYLGVNVTEQGVTPGKEMTVGLPMRGFVPHQQIPDALRFTVRADLARDVTYTAAPFSTTIDGAAAEIESAVFSPTQGTIRVVFRRDVPQEELKNWALPFDWSFAELYSTTGEKVGFVWDSTLDYDTAGQVSVTFSIMPPAKWPERLMLAMPGQDGASGIQKIILELLRNKPG